MPEGSLLPLGPEMEWSDEKPAETIDLYVFAGRDGSFTLYEDENTNYNYENVSSTSSLSVRHMRKALTSTIRLQER